MKNPKDKQMNNNIYTHINIGKKSKKKQKL